MKIPVRRSCISLIVLTAFVEAIRANENETATTEGRRGRVSGRIIKLYSGYKPDPVFCTEEGFKADPVQCSIFYRCLKSSSGKYTIFKFQCGPGTVYDPETEVCNHASSTKRSECGGTKSEKYEKDTGNHLELHELPSPISTFSPYYTSATNINSEPTTYKVPSASISNAILPSIETGYSQMLTTHSIPNNLVTTYKYEEEVKHNSILNPWGDYKNVTQQKIASSTSALPLLGKSQLCTSDGFMGDSENCKKFYRCVSNSRGGFIRYEFICSEPTVWDDHMQSCNHPWAVRNRRCGRDSIIYNERYTQTSRLPNNVTTEQIDGSYGLKLPETQNLESHDAHKEPPIYSHFENTFNNVDESSITEKNQISHGSPFDYPKIQNSDKNRVIEASTHINELYNYNYGQKSTTQGAYSTKKLDENISTEIRQSFICTYSGFSGDPDDCKKFYRCVPNGKSFLKYEFSCSQGTVWDKKIEACNHAWAVKECGGTSTTNSLITTDNYILNTSINTNSTNESIYNNYNVNNVNKGYEPQGTVTITTSVPEITTKPPNHQSTEPEKPQIYNEYHNAYGPQAEASLPNFEKDIQKTTVGPTINQNNDCESTGFRGDTHDCKKFYRCVDNGDRGFIKYEFSCGEGTVWDPEIEACNHAWAVKNCGNSVPSKDKTTSSFIDTTHSPTKDLEITTSPPQKENNDYDSGYGHQTNESTTRPNVDLESTTFKQNPESANNNCHTSGFIGDDKNCNKFYRCVYNGDGGFTQFEFSCGEGTVWDPEIEACNHEWAVKHCGRNTPSTQNPTSSTANFNDVETNNGYVTNNYTDNHSNPNNIAEITTSISSSTASSTTTLLTVTSTSNECKSSGFMGDNNDCQKFYRCVDNGQGGYIKHEFLCGEGTVWDSKIEACNHKWAVQKCGGTSQNEFIESTTQKLQHTTTSPVTESVTTVPPTSTHPVSYPSSTAKTTTLLNPLPSHSECNSEGYFGDLKDCRKFYRCVNDGKNGYTKYDFDCAEGTAWDVTIESCNYISKVEACHVNQSTTETKPMYDEAITESDTTKSTTSTSISASTTTRSTTSASTSSAYTTIMSTTESTSAPTTATTSTSTSASTSASTAETTLAGDNKCKKEGYFGDTNNCKNFYRCVDENNGVYTKYDFTCGDGTIWDQDITTCNHPRDVKNPSCKSESESSSTSTSTPNTSPTTASNTENPHAITTDKPSKVEETSINNDANSNSSNNTSETPNNNNVTCPKAGFYANPSNCKKFYRCVDWENNGKKFSIFHFECGDGTIWDPALETCNHESSVYPPRHCNGTQQQNETTQATSSTTETMSTTTISQTDSTTTVPTKTTVQSTTTTEYSSTQTTQSSTENPSTQSSTEESTTQISTTQSSTTEKSTTQTSTTQSTTTEEVTTHSSTTAESTTQSSTTGDSTTQSSTTVDSTTQSSTSADSTTQSSTTADSTTQSSTTTDSTAQSSTTMESTTQSSTTEESTTQSSTTEESTTKDTTTQSSTTDESTTQSTTTKEPTTEESTTSTTNEQTTSTTQMTTSEQTSTTTEASTTSTESSSTSTESQESTTETSTKKECPETANDQSLYVCPTSFKRHPKYCNLFYQCTEENESHELKIAVFKCPNNTIYDENKVQCLTENKSTKKCDAQISQKSTAKQLGSTLYDPFVVTEQSMACNNPGHYPFEKRTECSPSLLKCELTKSGIMRSFVYKCPDDYVYWNISRRCEPIRKVKDCKRSSYPWKSRYDIPLERFNIAP